MRSEYWSAQLCIACASSSSCSALLSGLNVSPIASPGVSQGSSITPLRNCSTSLSRLSQLLAAQIAVSKLISGRQGTIIKRCAACSGLPENQA